jgi:hypothetical protein
MALVDGARCDLGTHGDESGMVPGVQVDLLKSGELEVFGESAPAFFMTLSAGPVSSG